MENKAKKKPIKINWEGGIANFQKEKPVDVKGNTNKIEIQNKLTPNSISGKAFLKRESKGRSGKPVAILYNFSDSEAKNEESLKLLCSQLKNKLACGGTVENNEIVLTIRDFEKLKNVLESMNINCKIV